MALRGRKSGVDLKPPQGGLPSPLWGGVGGGGREGEAPALRIVPPPSPALPHKGGGSRPSVPPALTPFHRNSLLASFAEGMGGEFSMRRRELITLLSGSAAARRPAGRGPCATSLPLLAPRVGR